MVKQSAELTVNEKTTTDSDGARYSFAGTREDGIEVFVTDKETLELPWSKRKKKYLDFIKEKYRGRTAKFIRNGHTYYAEFDRNNAGKAIYGDSRSDSSGRDAIINTGADGDIFELLENSRYDGSGINTKDNTDADYFDYFVKTVQIDNKVFDLLADIEKNYSVSGGGVYTLRLVENKKIEASPIQEGQASLKNSDNASTDSINQNDASVKYSISKKSENDTEKMLLQNGSTFVFDGGDSENEMSVDVVVDSFLSDVSENPVQNKVVKKALDEKQDSDNISEKCCILSRNDLS